MVQNQAARELEMYLDAHSLTTLQAARPRVDYCQTAIAD